MKIGALFSGIGGLELGLSVALGAEIVWQVENDPDLTTTPVDVRDVSFPPAVDLLCGGFPCQDVSVAGKQAGLAGARSGLWSEYERIVREIAPRWCVVENVAQGVRAWLPTVRHELSDAGYRTAAVALSAADVGAPHLRRRVFVVAYSDSAALRDAEQRQSGRRSGQVCDSGEGVALDAGAPRRRKAEPGMGRGGHGLPAGLYGWPSRRGEEPKPWEPPRVSSTSDPVRLRALGNAVVPQCAFVIGRMIATVEIAGEDFGEVFC